MSTIRRVKLFKNGRSQAVRLPRAFRFEGVREVSIRREGKAVILEPVEELSWADWWKSWRRLGKELMPGGRKQPAMQARELDLE